MKKFNSLLEKINNYISKYSLPILGLLIFMAFIWLRFIRTRLPKDIPLKYVSFLGLCILIFICIVYFLTVKYLIKSNKTSEKRLIKYFVEFVYTPLESFDTALKHGWDSNTFILRLAKRLEYFIKDTNLLYWCFFIFPRIILVSILSIDIFIFHKLKYIYYALILTVPILLRKYLIYSFKVTKKHLVTQLEPLFTHIGTPYVAGVHPAEEEDEEVWDPDCDMPLPLGIFVDFQAKNIVYQGKPQEYDYYFSPYYYKLFREKHGLQEEQLLPEQHWAMIQHEEDTIYIKQIEEIITLASIIEYYNKAHHHNDTFRYIKIVIFSAYFICWFYILIVSLPDVDWVQVAFALWETVLTEKNPFM